MTVALKCQRKNFIHFVGRKETWGKNIFNFCIGLTFVFCKPPFKLARYVKHLPLVTSEAGIATCNECSW